MLDTPNEAAFDRITALAARLFGVPMALVSLIDEDRQWWKSCVGVEGQEAERDTAFCAHAILSDGPLIIADATTDIRFRDNPAVLGEPFVRFYAGAPLTNADGYNVGTLCIVDTQPRTLDAEQVATLVDLSRVIVDELELRLGYRTRALFQKVCEMSPDLLYIFDRVQQRRTFLGRGLTETLGYDARVPLPELLDEIVHPEDRSELQRHRDEVGTAAETVERTYRLRDVRGDYRWFLLREGVFERAADGSAAEVLGIATEITGLKNTQLALSRSRELAAERVRVLEAVLDGAGEGIVVADASGRFTVFNPAARRIVGLPANGPVPETWPREYRVFVRDGSAPIPAESLPLARALRGEPTDKVELLLRYEGGRDALLRVTGRPLHDDAGSPCGGIVTFNDVTALCAAEAELARLAVTDTLTGVPNRRAFDERFALLVAEGGRGRSFALALADVDHFKEVNDTHGHAMGDEVLVRVARTLQGSVRKTDFVARFGGEEFCVLFSDVDESQALRLTNNLRCQLGTEHCPVPVTVSFGICANRPGERTDTSALLRAADRALYAAKHEGRNRVIVAQLSAGESFPIVGKATARA